MDKLFELPVPGVNDVLGVPEVQSVEIMGMNIPLQPIVNRNVETEDDDDDEENEEADEDGEDNMGTGDRMEAPQQTGQGNSGSESNDGASQSVAGRSKAARGRPSKGDESVTSLTCRWDGCGMVFPSAKEARIHERTHGSGEDEGVYICRMNGCGRRFRAPRQLRKHLILHQPRSLVCSTCGKSFHDIGKLHRHEKIHSGDKPFNCPECGKEFSLRANLKTHMRVHTGERPFACSFTGCNKRFAQACNRNTHYQTHFRKFPSDGDNPESDDGEIKVHTLSSVTGAPSPPMGGGTSPYVRLSGTGMDPSAAWKRSNVPFSAAAYTGTATASPSPYRLPSSGSAQQQPPFSWRSVSASSSSMGGMRVPGNLLNLMPSTAPTPSPADLSRAASTSSQVPNLEPISHSISDFDPEAEKPAADVEDASLLLYLQGRWN